MFMCLYVIMQKRKYNTVWKYQFQYIFSRFW